MHTIAFTFSITLIITHTHPSLVFVLIPPRRVVGADVPPPFRCGSGAKKNKNHNRSPSLKNRQNIRRLPALLLPSFRSFCPYIEWFSKPTPARPMSVFTPMLAVVSGAVASAGGASGRGSAAIVYGRGVFSNAGRHAVRVCTRLDIPTRRPRTRIV